MRLDNYSVYMPSYSIGEGVYDRIGEVCLAFGKRAVIIGGKRAREAAAGEIRHSALEAGIELTGELWYGGEASYENVEALETTVGEHTTDIASLESGKADKATSLAGYGITDAYTKGETDSAISSAVAASQHLTKVVLDDEEDLPDASSATQNAIYLKKIADGSGNQYYEEFIVINDQWEKIGDTKVDLSNYATQSWVTSQISPVSTKADANAAAIEVINGSGAGSINKALQDAKEYADSLASNYATAAQGTKADSALQKADIVEGTGNGTIAVKGTDVTVHGLKSAAYTDSSAYDPAGSADTAEDNARAYTDTALTWGTF